MSIISKEQHSAIELVQQITSEVVNDPNTRKAFCEQVKASILDQEGINIQPYRKVLSAVLNWQISDKNLSNYTLRNATWNILKVLTEEGDFTKEEREKIGRKVKQWWWKRGVIATHIVQGMVPLTEQERVILDEIFKSNDPAYKRWTTRNIKKIMEKLEGESGMHRDSESVVKKYLQNLSTAPKKKANSRNDPEEIQTLKDLFVEYYDPSRKLPTKIIMQRLNEKHGRNRNENSIEWFIRTHIKTEEQKMKNESPRTEEELISLKKFIGNKEYYRKKKGRWIWWINRELIFKEYKRICPDSNRTQRALEHKLKDLWKKNKK